jgi:hypothetical protein
MSIVMNRAPFVEMKLLKSILATSISAVGVATFAGVVDSVFSYRELHSVGFCLFGSDQAYQLPVCDVFHVVCWHLMLEDELDSVGKVLYAPSDAICQLPKFFGC